MSAPHAAGWTRRRFLGGLTVAGTAGLLGLHPRGVTAEPPPETTTLTLAHTVSLCQAPQYIADALLRDEGFTEVQYVKDAGAGDVRPLAAGAVDLTMTFVGPLLLRLDEGAPVILLGGGHIGCLELFGTASVRSLRDLKGKTVAVAGLGSAPHVFLSSIMASIGLDPRTDIHLVTQAPDEAMRRLETGEVDVYITSPLGSGTPSPGGRPYPRQQRDGSPVVPILLLHAGREPDVRPSAPGSDQAGAARHSESDGHLCP